MLGRRFDEAADWFEASRRIFDKSPRLELGLGIARYGQRRFDAACEAFMRAAALAPALEQPHYFLGRMIEHAGERLPEALARFEAFSRARPESYLGPFLQAKALLTAAPPAGDEALFRQAESLLRQSIELQPKFWESHFELGVLLDRMERREEAAQSLERAIELSPQSPAPHYRLARVYSRLGKREQARSEAETHRRLEREARSAFAGGMARSLEEAVLE